VLRLNKNSLNKIKAYIAIVENGLAKDAEQAKSMLSCGLVFSGDTKLTSSSYIDKDDITNGKLRVKYTKPYVSRGAIKLETVFKEHSLKVEGFKCADIGASTGGFTQLLLEKGASLVFAVDVAKGILDYKIRMNEKVVVLEEVNARLFDKYEVVDKNIPKESLDLVVFDLSFISLKMVVPVVLPYVKKGGYVIPMIKPQFEAAKDEIGLNGVVRDDNVVKRILGDMKAFFGTHGLRFLGVTASQIKGPSGNQEYFYIMLKE
jgi:23S rRNA (cytidine1920-2'-O)/16S rRNA (cytidine1409-2'-O)-methyltransferase